MGTINQFPITTVTNIDSIPSADRKWLFREIVGGVGKYVYIDSGNSAASNLSLIQSALDGYGYVKLVSNSETVEISDSIVIYSNSTLDLGGLTLKMAATSAANSVIYNYGYPSTPASLIRVTNGTIDYNNANRSGSPDTSGVMITRFSKVNGLRLDTIKIVSQATGINVKYAILAVQCDNVLVDCEFDTNSDGFHALNGGNNHRIYAHGRSGDDLVAYGMGDFTTYNPLGTDIKDYDAISVFVQADTTDLAMIKLYGWADPDGTAVTISNSGTTATVTEAAHGRAAGDYVFLAGCTEPEYNCVAKVVSVTDANTWTFELESAPSGSATGSPVTCPYAKFRNFTIENLQGSALSAALKIVHMSGLHIESLLIKAMQINQDAFSGNYIQFLQGTTQAGSGGVLIDNFSIIAGGTFNFYTSDIFLSAGISGSTAVIKSFTLEKARFIGINPPSSGYGTIINASDNLYIYQFMANDIVGDGASVFIKQNSGAMPNSVIKLNNFHWKNSNTALQIREPVDVHLNNVSHTNNLNKLIVHLSANAATKLYGTCLSVGTDTKTIDRSGLGTVNVYGLIYAASADVTAAAGTVFINGADKKMYAWNGTTNAAVN